MNKNEQLLAEQKYWVENILRPFYENDLNDDKRKVISHPFYMGLNDRYLNGDGNKKKIMIVGRETLGFGNMSDGSAKYSFIPSTENVDGIKAGNSPENSQKWAIDYLDYVVYKDRGDRFNCYRKKNEKEGMNNNSSWFWNLFRWMKEDFLLCWNNIDKIHLGKTLPYDAEKILSAKYQKTEKDPAKSLFLREVEIANPDAILFVTGNAYYGSMQAAVNCEGDKAPTYEKDSCLVRLNKPINGVPAFWTNHPNGFRAKHFGKNGIQTYVIEKFIEALKDEN